MPAARTEEAPKRSQLKVNRLLSEDGAWSRRALAPPTNGPRAGRLHSQRVEDNAFHRYLLPNISGIIVDRIAVLD